jgi:antitoxin component of MazEF toxin-antitoxin module
MSVNVKPRKIGGSIAVIIPSAVASEMGITTQSILEIDRDRDKLVMRKHGRRPRRPMSEIAAQIDPKAYAAARQEFPDTE